MPDLEQTIRAHHAALEMIQRLDTVFVVGCAEGGVVCLPWGVVDGADTPRDAATHRHRVVALAACGADGRRIASLCRGGVLAVREASAPAVPLFVTRVDLGRVTGRR